MNKIYLTIIALMAIVIIILSLGRFSVKPAATTVQQVPATQKTINTSESKILAYEQVLNTVGCVSKTTKHVAVPLSEKMSADFDYVVCKTESSKDYFNTDYQKVVAKDGVVLGYTSNTTAPTEIMKYWILNNEADVTGLILSDIKKTVDGPYCELSMIDHGDTKEWLVTYTGPYTGNGVEPASNCGGAFGTNAGARIIFSQKNVLMKTELGTENLYPFDPRTVKIK